MSNNRDLSSLEFVSDTEREYFARAKLGMEVEDFLLSDVGRFLRGRAKQEYEEAKAEALESNASSWFGRRKLAKAQQKAAVAQTFTRWCAEAIMDGRHAHKEIENKQ